MPSHTAVATQGERKPPTREQHMKTMLETRTSEFAKALAGRVDPEAFVRVAYATITKSPKLLEATPASLIMALLECASLGLVPNGVMGEAYIVPFNNKVKVPGQSDRWEVQAQFIPGYRGLVKLARQSGVIRNVVARVVRDGDRFEREYGLDERLVHVPLADDDVEISHVYAIAYFADGGAPQFEVMSKSQVDKIRERSKSKDSGPWVTDYEAMALKTVIRRLVKYLPLSDFDLARAIEADNKLDANDVSAMIASATRAALPASRTDEVRVRLSASRPALVEEEEEFTPPAPVEVHQGPPPPPEPASAQQEEAEKAGEPVDPVLHFLAEVQKTKPRGGSASDATRTRLAEYGNRLFGDGTEEAMMVAKLAEAQALGQGQAGRLLTLAMTALDDGAEPAAVGADAEDLFGEG